jgi:hypothetical protein
MRICGHSPPGITGGPPQTSERCDGITDESWESPALHCGKAVTNTHTATTAEADTLKTTEGAWVKVLGTAARVIQPTYGVPYMEYIPVKHQLILIINKATREECLKQCYNATNTVTSDLSAVPRCGYCAGKHNTKECMVKETDPKPAPFCVLCKGQYTA